MKGIRFFLTAFTLLARLATTRDIDSQMTPCFIPLRELAFTESIETIIPSTAVREAFSEHTEDASIPKLQANEETSRDSSDETSESMATTPTIEERSDIHFATFSNDIPSTTAKAKILDCNDIFVEEQNPLGTVKHGGVEDNLKGTLTAHAGETSFSTTTTEVTICVPYCAALDEYDRCIIIKGCGYPEEGNFGRHGCCPPGYYTGTEVLGLVMLATTISVVVMCSRW